MKMLKKKSWMRSALALILALAMLLCCGCGEKEEPTNPNALGDGDGKLEAQDFVDGFTKIYGATLGAMGGQTATSSHTQMDIDITLGDDILGYAGNLMELYELPSDMTWLKQLGFNLDMNYSRDVNQMVMGLQLGKTNVASAEFIMDMVGGKMFARLPGLNDQYLGYASEVNQEPVVMGPMGEIEDYAALISALPSEEALNTLLTRYLNLLLEQLEDPTVVTQTLSCKGITQEVTATTHTIRRSDVLDMAESVLKTAQTDAELEQMLDTFNSYYNAQCAKTAATEGYTWEDVDLHQQMQQYILDALADIAETRAELEDADFLVFSFYTQEEDQLGFSLKAIDETESVEINAYGLRQEENTALLLEVKDSFRFSGTGTEKDGVANGQYTLTVQDTEMGYVEVKNFDTEALKNGELKGQLVLSMSETMIEEFFGPEFFLTTNTKISINMNILGDGGTTACQLLEGEKLLLGVTTSTKILETEAVQIPTEYVDPSNEEELGAWLSAIDLNKVLENLRQAGVPAELVDMMGMYLN